MPKTSKIDPSKYLRVDAESGKHFCNLNKEGGTAKCNASVAVSI
jgi:hypothetical protein